MQLDAPSSSTPDATFCCKENLYFYGSSFASKVIGQKLCRSHLWDELHQTVWNTGYISKPHFTFHTDRGQFCLILASCCLIAESCPALCDPVDCSPPGSSVHGILQARILEWAAVSVSRGCSQPRDQTHISCTGRRVLFTAEPPGKPRSVLWMVKATASHAIIIGYCSLVSLNEATNSPYSNRRSHGLKSPVSKTRP